MSPHKQYITLCKLSQSKKSTNQPLWTRVQMGTIQENFNIRKMGHNNVRCAQDFLSAWGDQKKRISPHFFAVWGVSSNYPALYSSMMKFTSSTK